MPLDLVFSNAEFINIVAGAVGGEALTRFVDQVKRSHGTTRHLAKRIRRRTADLIVDVPGIIDLLSDISIWQALADEDSKSLEPIVARLANSVARGESPDTHRANCLSVARIVADELLNTLTLIERLQIKTHNNTSALMGDLSDLSLSLNDRLDSLHQKLSETLLRRPSNRLPALVGVSDELILPIDHALVAAAQIHSDSLSLSGEQDEWQIRNFDMSVLRSLLGELIRLLDPIPLPGELLLMHLIPLYIDTILNIECIERKMAIADPNQPSSQIVRADLGRVRSASPGIVKKTDAGTNSSLTTWLAHRATALSPSIWESWTAYRVAAAMAEVIEQRESTRGVVATMIRRLARNAAFDPEQFDNQSWSIRLPDCAESLVFAPRRTAALTRFVWQATLDPRRMGTHIAEHVGLSTAFDLSTALEDLASAQWVTDGSSLELDAWCSYPAVAQVLIEHADSTRRLLDDFRRDAVLPVRPDMQIGSGRIRPRIRANGRPIFELPLVQLRLSQQETRQLLMGTALYGSPDLAIREMYQNALDACRYREVRREYLQKAHPGSAPAYQPRVEIRQDASTATGTIIECIDNGVGMSYVELRDAFAQAGRKFTDLASFQDEQARWAAEDADLKLYPNSRFGIGVFSYFMLADEVEVTTVRENPDGTLGTPLHVHVSSLSGLLTISELDRSPADLIAGGTKVRLVVGESANATDERSLSALGLLEELVWHTDVELVVSETGRDPLIWHAHTLAGTAKETAKLAFYTDSCRGYWTQSRGAVLADGIKTDIELPGLVVDLRGPHSPALRADRNCVLDWDEDWVIAQFARAATAITSWLHIDLEWICRVALRWPRIGSAVVEKLSEADTDVPIGAGAKPDTLINVREVGCLSADMSVLEGRTMESSPFPIPSPIVSSEFERLNRPRIEWPSALLHWRRRVWQVVGVDVPQRSSQSQMAWRRRSEDTPVLVSGQPIPTVVESGLFCSVMQTDDFGGRFEHPEYVRADRVALLAGAARAEIAVGDAIRAVRRYHVVGIVMPDVDARELDGMRVNRYVVDHLVSSFAALNARDARAWIAAAIVTAQYLGRPLEVVWSILDAMTRLGHPTAPPMPASLAKHSPTKREAEILINRYGALSFTGILQRFRRPGLRNFSDLLRVLAPYEVLLAAAGVDVKELRRIVDHQMSDQERIAWSKDGDGRPPWLYGEAVSITHIIGVACRLEVSLASAEALVRRCPGASISWNLFRRSNKDGHLPEVNVDSEDLKLALAWESLVRDNHGENLNCFAIADWAVDNGLDPGVAVARLVHIGVPGVPTYSVDWGRVRQAPLSYQQRELLMRRTLGPRDNAPTADSIHPARVVECSSKLRIGISDLTASADSLREFGIRWNAPAAPVPKEHPTSDDAELIREIAFRGKSSVISLLASVVAGLPGYVGSQLESWLDWMRWLWQDDGEVSTVLKVAENLHDVPGAKAIDSVAVEMLRRFEQIVDATGPKIGRAHIVEAAGGLGVSITRARELIAPFEVLTAARGWIIPWFQDPLTGPPGWLDVAVVGLIVARGPSEESWNDVAEFFTGNVNAPRAAIEACYLTWSDLIRSDRDGFPTATFDSVRSSSGMVAWRPIRSTGTEGG